MAFLFGIWILITPGCSSTPPGTIPIGDLVEKEAELLDRNVVVVGIAETVSAMSSFNMFRVYNRGDYVWVVFPDTLSMPPQGEKIRVGGKLGRKKFSGISKEQLYIDATSVSLE